MKNQKGVSLITLIITIIVVIILAVIVLRSGASDAPDQAAFSGFTQEMGELQDAVKVAMLEAKSSEILKGNQRTEAQLYNFVARGGYEVFNNDKDISGDAKWLLQAHEKNYQCVQINRDNAKTSIGMELPDRDVETAQSIKTKVQYFLTPKGIVFCWPPYVYDGKSYVNAETTVKSASFINDEGKPVISGDEMKETEATMVKETVDNGNEDVLIVFENEEYVKVKNSIYTYGNANANFQNNPSFNKWNNDPNIWIDKDENEFTGIGFEVYNNKVETFDFPGF